MSRLEADVAADPAAISDWTRRVADFLRGAGVDVRAAHHVALVLDEILNNVASHGGGPKEPTRVRIAVERQRIVGEILDSGSPFDPRSGPRPDVAAKIEHRPIGGLGLYLVTKLTSGLDYAREGDRNRTTFTIARN